MIQSKIKRKGRSNLTKLKKKIKSLSEKSIKTGLFADQGKHPKSDLTFPEVAYVNSIWRGNIPPRDIRFDAIDALHYYDFYTILSSYFFYAKPLDSVLNTIATDVEDISKNFFGVPSVNNPSNSPRWAEVKGGDTPLVHYGYMRDAWESRVIDAPVTFSGDI